MTLHSATRRLCYAGLAAGAGMPPTAASPVRRIRGVVFDMDGTLTLPQSNFIGRMRRELAVPDGTDVLAHAASLEAKARLAAEQLIKQIEDEAMLTMEMQPGLETLVEFLEAHQLPKAILTRNNRDTVQHFLALREPHHRFDPLVTRDFLPPKPAPDPLLHIARTWGIAPEELLMVGDHLDDLACARAAGAASVLLRNPKNAHFEPNADRSVHRLDDIIPLLQNGFCVERADPSS
ncbi:haloacid dehalogenase-like hydrolase [Thamnocephalis sphaerospora]|uniref:Haloacid dehalogenase-like hydrolase n=1 Tax=Thamnocephalis sphaerospora TaxID=78915 RepID=A0A4P9XS50_9FUNG|nr:haloacid dehalogenase-like hydrolase [Thamnocephalis sphaerospora]|eukprot:RKP08792.1 haloacid dehalogenase-like hydrolase [Thamnocephalis sphaerospora]